MDFGMLHPEGRAWRQSRGRRKARQTAIGWGAALLLHGGLLAAVILGQPAALAPSPGRAAVSLLVLPPARTQPPAPVKPRPAEMPASPPESVPKVIANAPPARRAVVPEPRRPAPSPAAPMAGRAAQEAPALPAGGGFVAAEPLAGDVNQPPEYPDAAIAHGEQGKVLLSIHVLPDGRTDFVSVTRSSGYRVLDQAARDAVMEWRFRPASLAGKPVVMVIPYWIDFDLQTESVRPGQ